MTKSGGYLAGQKAKPPLTAGVADVSIPRPRRGAGRQRARAVRETGTQKSPLNAWLVRAILRLCTLQMPCPRRDTGGPGVRVVRATGTQKPPPTAKPVRAVGGACPRFKHQSQKKRRQAGKMCRGLRAKTQKPPLAARRVRAILGLSTLQRPHLPNGGGAFARSFLSRCRRTLRSCPAPARRSEASRKRWSRRRGSPRTRRSRPR